MNLNDLLNKNMPTIRQLQCFVAVAYELNFRKAAERLLMTQPPLTRQIKALEDVLEQTLFIRDTHDVALTESGKALLVKAETLLKEMNQLKEPRAENAQIRIGLTQHIDFENLPSFKQALLTLGKDEIDAPQLTSIQLLKSLMTNKLDIAIVAEEDQHNDSILFEWLYQEPLYIALPSSHPVAQKEAISLSEVTDLPLFWFNRNAHPKFYDKCEQVFTRLGLHFNRVKEPEDSLTMLSHVANGKGFALMPQ